MLGLWAAITIYLLRQGFQIQAAVKLFVKLVLPWAAVLLPASPEAGVTGTSASKERRTIA